LGAFIELQREHRDGGEALTRAAEVDAPTLKFLVAPASPRLRLLGEFD